MTRFNLHKILTAAGLSLLIAYGMAAGLTGSAALDTAPAQAQTGGNVPGNWSGNVSDTELWRAVRRGVTGTVSIPDKKAAVLVQSDGDNWRAFRNGPVSQTGGWLLLATIVVLALFFFIRGRIRIGAGFAGETIERFNALERFTHWLTASSFIVLALTGLNVLYGRYVLKPILGADAFSTLTYWGKLAHNYIAYAFMIGLVLMFVLWVRDNLWHNRDFNWIMTAGGLFQDGVHADSARFNFGQKAIFWVVILGGASLAVSGLALVFPYEIQPWSGTFALLNTVGFDLPTNLTPLQETQLSVLWHSLAALIMIAIVIAHIYIGSLGMEGAIDAVGTGQVDINWAREHHNLWVAEMEEKASTGGQEQPAE